MTDANAASPVIAQLYGAGVLTYLIAPKAIGTNEVRATAPPALLAFLQQHPRFTEGDGHQMHRDVGDDRRDFRGDTGVFGKGVLQVVTGWKDGTLHVYADIDLFNPNGKKASKIGHAGEVLYGFWRRFAR